MLKALDDMKQRIDKLEKELAEKVNREEVDKQMDTKIEAALGVPQKEPTQAELAEIKGSGVEVEEVAAEEAGEPSSQAKGAEIAPQADGGEDQAEGFGTPRAILEDRIMEKRESYLDEVQEKIRKRIRYFQRMGYSDNDGDKATDLSQEQRESIDEDFWMKKYAKEEIMKCNDATEIIIKAELLIDEDWLCNVTPLPGNLFSVGAFGEIFERGAKPFSDKWIKSYSKAFGCCIVILIQLIGPPLIFMSRMPSHLGILDDKKYDWRCHPLFGSADGLDLNPCPSGRLPGEIHFLDDWHRLTMTKLLGVIFMGAFILNGLFSIISERKTWRDLYNTFRFLDWKNDEFKAPGGWYLGAGCFVNCWVVTWACLDIFVVAGASADPQDLLMDSFALLFLFNLDDIDGDLCFVTDDDWPGLRLAWIYNELVHPWPDTEFDEDDLDWLGYVGMLTYKFTIALLCIEFTIIPALAMLTPFVDIAPMD